MGFMGSAEPMELQRSVPELMDFEQTVKQLQENKTFYNCYCVEVKTTSFWMTNHFHRSNQGPNCFGASFEVDLFLELPCVLASGSRNYVFVYFDTHIPKEHFSAVSFDLKADSCY